MQKNRVFLFSYYVTFCLTLTLSVAAQAIVGNDHSVVNKGPNNICRLVMTDSDGVGICTGSLIRSNQILTAAHCVDHLKPDAKVTVSCGYRGFDKTKLIPQKTKSGNTVYLAGVNFSEEAIVNNISIHPKWSVDQNNFDIAIVQLDRHLKAAPMTVIDPLTMTEPIKCWSAGYGINKNVNMGFLQIGTIDGMELQKNLYISTESKFSVVITEPKQEDDIWDGVPALFKYLDKKTLKDSVMVYGDSGGPVFCKKQNSPEIFQTSINRALYYTIKPVGKTLAFDVTYMSAFSRLDLEFIKIIK